MTDGQAPVGSLAVPRRRLALWASAATAIILGVGGLTAWRWYNTAADLYAYTGISQGAPFRVGQTFYLGSDIQPKSPTSGHRTLDVHRVTPHITVNTAHADVEVVLCRLADPHNGLGSGLNTSPCATVTMFHPGSVDLGFPATEIIYKITSASPGTIRIEGADVSYYDGTRRGIQRAGSGSVVTVTR